MCVSVHECAGVSVYGENLLSCDRGGLTDAEAKTPAMPVSVAVYS